MKKIILAIILISIINFSAYSDQNDPRLEILFNNLLQIETETKAMPTIAQIWTIWSTALDKKVQAKFDIGNKLMEKRQFKASIDIFSEVINLQPNFAEAWNKRATVNYIIGNYDNSISDIFSTLDLEPRHFGALDGLAQIYFNQDKYFEAAQIYKKILKIIPYNKKAIMRLEYLEQSFI
jgi:tetratricopeptide (TPR) repeat protein